MTDIFGRFAKVEQINKGWSDDKKYCVTDADGVCYLLRTSPFARYENRKQLHDIMGQVSALGVPMCQPIEFGECEDGVYCIQSWIDGQEVSWLSDGEDVSLLPSLSENRQYELGVTAGEILRKIHTIPASDTQEDWAARYNKKIDRNIKKYYECGLRFDGDERVIAYIERNRHLLNNRPQCFQHGDYHVGNMMLENGELKIIDFGSYDFGDPWEEFSRIVWNAAASPLFATGQVNGYFGGTPLLEFFKLIALYIASSTLSSIYWAIPYGQREIDVMMRQSQQVLGWLEGMRSPVPMWYRP